MGKALIIAEKPSVALDISKALGGFKRQDDHFENDQYVISSAVGHLLELIVPEGVEPARGKWSFTHLPVIPPHFELQPIEKSAARLRGLTKLIKRKDIDLIVKRSLIYGVVTATVAAIYIGTVYVMGSLISGMMGEEPDRLVTLLALVLVAFAFDPLKQNAHWQGQPRDVST